MLRGWLLCCAGCSAIFGIDPAKPGSDAGSAASCTIGSYDLCANQQPLGTLAFTADTAIDTDRDCELVLYQPGSVGACVLYATEISVATGITITPSGARPLVLAASGTIVVDGTIDASSTLTLVQNNPTIHDGPGANDPSCMLRRAVMLSGNGNGGGAGGTFGGKGGDGGDGFATPGGLASDVGPAPTFPRGGCPGGVAGFGNAAPGGGGLWLAAGKSIEVSTSGRLVAGGAGGSGSSIQGIGGGGAGGAGSGGLVHVAAPAITIAGTIAANGGGGAEGGYSGTTPQTGTVGSNALPGAMAAPGGSGSSSNGGDGGNGAAATTLAGSPGQRAPGPTGSFGGGGGGGAGIVQIVGNATTAGATISPPAQ